MAGYKFTVCRIKKADSPLNNQITSSRRILKPTEIPKKFRIIGPVLQDAHIEFKYLDSQRQENGLNPINGIEASPTAYSFTISPDRGTFLKVLLDTKYQSPTRVDGTNFRQENTEYKMVDSINDVTFRNNFRNTTNQPIVSYLEIEGTKLAVVINVDEVYARNIYSLDLSSLIRIKETNSTPTEFIEVKFYKSDVISTDNFNRITLEYVIGGQQELAHNLPNETFKYYMPELNNFQGAILRIPKKIPVGGQTYVVDSFDGRRRIMNANRDLVTNVAFEEEDIVISTNSNLAISKGILIPIDAIYRLDN